MIRSTFGAAGAMIITAVRSTKRSSFQPTELTEPTGRQATISAANIFRFENGKVVEIWNHRDDFGLHEQIGSPIHAGAPPEA